jgi:glycerol-3-phosphate acyltransferase PlsY
MNVLPAPLSSALALALSYLLGSTPWGLVLVRVFKGVDVRKVGSGNIGATNAMRAGGRGLGLAVFVLDFAKGWVAVYWISKLAPDSAWIQIACGAAAVLGHCFPVWLGFKGGKGVSTLCGAVVASDWRVFLCGGVVWLLVVAATRYVGLASFAMCLALPIAAWWLLRDAGFWLTVGLAALALLILTRHRSNMARMLAGTEPKIGHKRAGGDDQRG